MFGGFSERDGTLDFYLRINSALSSEMTILDLGAGRGAWIDTASGFKARLLSLKGKVREVIAADIDPVVLENPNCDRAILIDGGHLPLADASVDLILSDFVLEHVSDPPAFVAEIHRVLKPGGWFCARTPHRLHYVAILSRLIPDRSEGSILAKAQPGRRSDDVFPKIYKMNCVSDLDRLFRGWEDKSFIFRSEPSYYFGNLGVYAVLDFLQRLMPAPFSGTLMVFKCKPK